MSSWIEKFDIVFITETHLIKGTRFSLPKFKEFHNPLSDHTDRKPHGGVSCFIKSTILHLIRKVHIDTSEMIVLDLVGGHKIFSNYIVPVDSPYSDITAFSNIANVFTPTNSDSVVIGGGDLNARVGDIKQKIPSNCSYRLNPDKQVNEHGKTLLSICSSFKCYVLNNMDIGTISLAGDFTFQKGERKSQNDILLTNKSGITSVRSMEIHCVRWNPSDHKPVSVQADLDVTDVSLSLNASRDILSQPHIADTRKARKIKNELIDWDAYKTIVESDFKNYEGRVESLQLDQSIENIDEAVNLLSDSIYKSASLLSSSIQTDTGEVSDPLIREADRIAQRWTASENDSELTREEIIEHLKHNVASKDRKSWMDALNESDPKALWQKINWKGTFDKKPSSGKPSLESLRDHFVKKGQSVEDSTLLSDVTGDNHVPELDGEITLKEIEDATNTLKDKSSGDGWTKKMLTNLSVCIMLAMQVIYNTVLSAHAYPTKWRTTVVNEIFKNKGEEGHAENYRGVSLVYLLSKVYDFVLNNRFTNWFKPNDAQTAYQDGKSSADHVFLLRCIVQQVKRYKKKLFLIAADFDGAFDRISRSLLIRKLIRFGAGTIFVGCIASMYMCTDNVIFRDHDYITYKLFSGIKQGLPLSPILFIFYINDIFDFFISVHGRCLDNIHYLIHILVHADDVTLLAENRESAIAKVNSLCKYCQSNFIVPQKTKCKFSTINGTPSDNEPLPFGDTVLKNVDHLEILGSHIAESGSLNDDLELHMKKRFSSCIKFYNFCKENKAAPLSVRIKTLKACVMSSLLYNCETFGHKLPKNLETVYHQMIRAALHVRSNTPALLLYIESGLLPVRALVEARQHKFYDRFRSSLDPAGDRIIVFNDLESDPSTYLQHYQNLHATYVNHSEIYEFYSEQIKTKIRTFAAEGRYKFDLYNRINPNLEDSPFLQCMHPLATDIVRFRLGSHNLPIEKGRWSRRRREERLCETCGVLGDERHVIYECSLVSRENLNLDEDLSRIWTHEDVFALFRSIRSTDFL